MSPISRDSSAARDVATSGLSGSARLPLLAVALIGIASCGGHDDGAAPDPIPAGPQGAVGQFVVECAWSHSGFDDPIVHPGHAGASHRHDFFGNTTTDAQSEYESLLAGDTTCRQRLDTAAYWVPSLLDTRGAPIEPLGSTAYYRAGVGADPATVQPYPPGLMMVAGDAGATSPSPISIIAWSCGTGGMREPAPPPCSATVGPRLLVTFPDCWDGALLDTEDHRSHVAYSHDGQCDDDHPVAIPQLQFAVDYPAIADDPATLSLASGSFDTAHADFWNAWDQDKLVDDVTLCLQRDIVCGVSEGI